MSRQFELLVARDHTAADRLVIAPVELPFMGERENVSREVQMVDVVGFLMVIAAYMALPNDGVWAVGRLIANKLERRRIVLLFNSKTSGKTAPNRTHATCALRIERACLTAAVAPFTGGSRE
ncbi:hypothetical protein [Bradyrhizobium sp. sBnM-33]|uniref:hypothetical protein n=1 Tax=Bradyrhizobium sp. sBnM-33 TaxID=2831780 RepID=UPI001BCDDDAC|nr:hypothetical protein [Bradyrhizobium sp. sBnM-33]WOH52716.1 hypothetical protein RX328_11650 [Bradyrhizobium sp. sBnM-33]